MTIIDFHYVLTLVYSRPDGAMVAREIPDLKVAGSIPVRVIMTRNNMLHRITFLRIERMIEVC